MRPKICPAMGPLMGVLMVQVMIPVMGLGYWFRYWYRRYRGTGGVGIPGCYPHPEFRWMFAVPAARDPGVRPVIRHPANDRLPWNRHF